MNSAERTGEHSTEGLSAHELVEQVVKTHLQKLNKTCPGQTIPEAETPLNVQTHEAQKRTVKDTMMSDRQ